MRAVDQIEDEDNQVDSNAIMNVLTLMDAVDGTSEATERLHLEPGRLWEIQAQWLDKTGLSDQMASLTLLVPPFENDSTPLVECDISEVVSPQDKSDAERTS